MVVIDVLVGILLGDAHISPAANSILVYGLTTKHKEFFNFLFILFIPFCTKDYIPLFKTIVDKRNNVTYTSFF